MRIGLDDRFDRGLEIVDAASLKHGLIVGLEDLVGIGTQVLLPHVDEPMRVLNFKDRYSTPFVGFPRRSIGCGARLQRNWSISGSASPPEQVLLHVGNRFFVGNALDENDVAEHDLEQELIGTR
jgi:hypothetical protein